MIPENYKWTSNHDAEKSEFDFGNGYKIIHHKKLNMCYKTKNGVPYDQFSIENMKLETFEQIQMNFLKSIQ